MPAPKEEKLSGGLLMTNEGSYVNYNLLVRIERKYPKVKIKSDVYEILILIHISKKKNTCSS